MAAFIALYRDGTTVELQIDEEMYLRGDQAVALICHAKQEAGEIPEGSIISVTRKG
jgi:hypothetical protein